MKHLDTLASDPEVMGIFIAPSKNKLGSVFCSITSRNNDKNVAGYGNTATEAVEDAIGRMSNTRPVAVQTMPAMPGMNRMPGM